MLLQFLEVNAAAFRTHFGEQFEQLRNARLDDVRATRVYVLRHDRRR
jgi:hypothetical protein